jgi:hypothetical protein
MSCEHDCTVPPVFPKPIDNRPGLDRIDYRIGTYAELRAHLLDQLDKAPAFSAWTHRGVDDPGIALLESAAIVGDILTYYQSLYANEAYLRTAQWRSSIMELVRLLGYRLAPGVGGEGVFAIALRARAKPVTVPRGFGLKAQVGGDAKPADFETSESLTAYPHLSVFRMYRPRKAPQTIAATQNKIEIRKVAGAGDVASIGAFKLKSGDRVMLVPPTATGPAEMMIVDKVETVLDRTVVTFKGALAASHGTQVTAYKIKRSFRHFGNNAAGFVTSVVELFASDGTTVTGSYVVQDPTQFSRDVFGTGYADDAGANDPAHYSGLAKTDMPLDQKVDNLAPGGKIVCQGLIQSSLGVS